MKNSYRLMMALAIACTTPVVNAEDVLFIPRVTTGYMNYKLELPGPLPGIIPPIKYEENLPVIGLGLTSFINNFYIDIYGQISANGSDTSNIPIVNFEEIYEGRRKDFSLAFGSAITDNLSFYVGYKYGELDTSGNKGGDARFKETGYFLGASYGWNIGNDGILTINLAIADLDGDIFLSPPSGFPLEQKIYDQTSNTQGLSYGISYKSVINKKWSYSVALDGYQYTFDDIVDKQSGAVSGEAKEDMFTARVSVSYLFD